MLDDDGDGMVFMIMVTVAEPHTPKTLAIDVAKAKML